MTNTALKTGQVLLVVDDHQNQMLLSSWLQNLDVRFMVVSTTEEAFDALEADAGAFVLCLIDESETLNVFSIVNKAIHHKEVAQVPLMLLKASPADKKRHIYQDLLKMVELRVKPISFDHFRRSIEQYFELYQRRQELSLAYEDVSQLWGSVSDGLIGLDADGFILFLNPTAARLLGASPNQLVGLNIQGFTENPQSLVQSYWSEHPISIVCRRKEMLQIDSSHFWRVDGRPLPVKLVAIPMSNVNGMVVMLAFKQKWQSRDEQGKSDLWIDQLTGALTRNALDARIFDILDGDEDVEQSLALLLINLDHFRYVNEAVSHKVGDLVLRAVAERIERCLRDDDLLARVGGDEFAVLLHHVANESQVEPVAQKILQQFEQPFLLGGHEVHCTASVGVAMSPRDGRTPSSLLAAASSGVSEVQSKGGNNVAMDAQPGCAQKRMMQDQRNDARKIINDQLWTVNFEPVFPLNNHSSVFVACDVRWASSANTVGSIESLAAESAKLGLQNRFIDDFLQFVFAYANEQLKYSDTDLVLPLIGPCVRHHAGLARWLDEYEWPYERLIIQVSERELMSSRGEAHENLHYLTSHGARLIVSHFGASLGSLTVLEGLSIWGFEMNMQILARPLMGRLVPCIAQQLGAKLWISGVDDREDLNICLDKQIDFVQGSITDDGSVTT